MLPDSSEAAGLYSAAHELVACLRSWLQRARPGQVSMADPTHSTGVIPIVPEMCVQYPYNVIRALCLRMGLLPVGEFFVLYSCFNSQRSTS